MKHKIQEGMVLIISLLALSMPAAPLQQMHGQVPRAAVNLTPAGRVASSQRLSFAIGLPLRNQAALSNLLQQIYDPASANFHHYLTPEQFTERFGPTGQDYEAVAAFALTNGLRIVARHPNRTLLDVEGSVADIEKALHVRMNNYRHPEESRTFYAPDADPSLDLTVPVAGISGLDNYTRPRPRLIATPLVNGQQATPNAGSGLGGTYLGKDFRAAYAPDSVLTGTGQSVGLLQFDGYTASDITYYETLAGLPNVPLTNVLLDGFGGGPTGSGGEVEVSLDIEMSISMAPGLSKVIVYMAGPYGNWHDILNRMANDNLARQLSCSWYIPGGAADPVADGIFQQMAAQGQSFMNASGDYGAYSGLISFPGDTPYITQVGGTFLTTTGPVGAWVSETTWNRNNGIATGGGISTQYPIPVWQGPVSMTANYGSTTQRNTPDVALTADNVYVRADGRDYKVGGTSCAAPLWAGFMSLMNQQAAANGLPPVGFLNPSVYKVGLGGGYAQAFHDITTGNNGSATHFPAVAGYDLCTGWGTPTGQRLINAIVPPDSLLISPAAGFAASGAVGGPFNITAQNFALTNVSAGPLTWAVSNPVTWLGTSSSGGVLPAGSVTNLLVSLNSASSNLAPGFYSASLGVTNVTSNFTHLLPFSLLVHDPLVIAPTNGFNAVGPVGGPFSVTSLNLSLSNSGLGAVNWSLSNNAAWLNASAGGGTLSPGATTNVTASLNATANSLPPALYSANLVFSNLTGGLVQDVPFTLQTGELPLQNNGFELGNFLGWTVSGNTVGMLVTSNALYVHSGVYGAQLGPQGTPGYLSQTLATSPGQVYLISFWLENEGVSGPDEFAVTWNGSTVFDEVNAGQGGWTNIQILVGATGTNSVLQFSVRNDNGNFGLDDVAVFQSPVVGGPPTITSQPTNETVTAGLTSTFSATATGIQPLYYQWQLGTSNIAGANNATLVLSPTTLAEAGNYTLVVSNAFGMTNSSNAVLTVNVPNCDPPAPGLVGWWAAEGNATDSFGTNNGMLVGGVGFTSGVVGQAFQFDGATGYVSIPASSSLDIGTNGGLTIETWIKPATVATLLPLVEWNNGAGGLGPVFWINEPTVYGGGGPGSLYANISDINGTGHVVASAPNLLATNTFNHVAFTYDKASGTGTLYLNGNVVATQNLGTFTPRTTYNVFLGTRPSSPYYFGGLMDEFSIYDVALSSNQIQAVYNSGSAGKCEVPPVIASQPQNQTVVAGNAVSFSVNANGNQPLNYQWFVNETNIPAATNATLVLTNVQLGLSGNLYSVVITNLVGSTNSSNALLTVEPAPPCTPPSSGLVSWWAAEGNANDSFGTNEGTLAGGVSFTAGEVGQAFQFDGATGYVSIPASASLDVGSGGGFTIEGWIKPNQLSTLAPLVEWDNGAGGLGPVFWINEPTVYGGGGPGSLYVNISDIGGTGHVVATGSGLLSTSNFNHVAFTYDKGSGAGTLYLNGSVVAIQNLGTFTPRTTYNVFLGTRPSSPYYFGGLMDEFSIYEAALSSNQIQAIYNAGSAGKCPSPPVIASQPQSQTAFLGSTVNFNVGANGSQPLNYQWFVNETNIPSATNATLVLTNVQLGQSGNLYSVMITNLEGSTNSSNALLTINVQACAPPPSGLVSWWAAEGNANDSFGTNEGTLAGGVSFTAGEVGQGFQFDGTTGYVSIPASASLDVGSGGGFTIEGWIKPNQLSTLAPLVEWDNGAGGLGPVFWINEPTGFGGGGPGSLYVNITDVSGAGHVIATGPNLLSASSFNHVAVTYDKSSGTSTLYLNGSVVASQNLGIFTPRTTYNVFLGTRPSSPYYFGGLIDEMSVYGRALSGGEIHNIYAASGYGKCAVPPVIAGQPQSQNVFQGSTASFSVSANGSQPLSYQWFVNATNIPMATNAMLVVTNVQFGQSGNLYSVMVSNPGGTTNSANAILTVFPPGTCYPPPAGLVSWWPAEGNAADSFGTNNGALSGGVNFSAGEVGQAFHFDGATGYVSVPSSASLNVGTNGGLTIEGWIKPSQLSTLAPLVEWNNGAGSFGPVLWINESTGFGGGGPGSLYANISDVGGTGHVVFSAPNLLSTGGFNHVALTYDQSSGTGTLYLNGAIVVSQNLGVFTPQTTYNLILGSRPSQYYFGGLMDEMSVYGRPLSGGEIQTIFLAGSGGKCEPHDPPSIASQPVGAAAVLGNSATFTVGVTGTAPFGYQWKFNQSNILTAANATATNAVLMLTNVQPASAGNYSVVVTNFYGSTNSSNAVLSLLFPPTITLRPHNQLVQLGCTVAFSSTAIGSGTLTYQWQKNGVNLPGQNGTNLALLNIQPADFGNYAMIASNAYGSATSAVAILALDHLPVPGGIIAQRFPGAGVRLNTIDIATKATDADNDPLSLISVAVNSVEGGTVTLSGPSIYYLPPAGLTNADAFNYTISDGHCGGTAVGTILVNVRTDTGTASRVTIVEAGNGAVQVIFDGMPGVAYRVQSTTDLTPPNWQDVTTLTADQYGTYIHTDWPATNGPVRYFRSVSP